MLVTKNELCAALRVSERTPRYWTDDIPKFKLGHHVAWRLLDLIPAVRRRPRGLVGAELSTLFEIARSRGVSPDEDTLHVGDDGLARAKAVIACLSPAERERWQVAASMFESCLVESPAFARPVFREIEELRAKLVLNPAVAAYVFLNEIGDLPERMPRFCVEFSLINATLRATEAA